jgi:hypothetical protein
MWPIHRLEESKFTGMKANLQLKECEDARKCFIFVI